MDKEVLLQRVKELERKNQEYKIRIETYQRNNQIEKKIEEHYQNLLDNSLVGIFQTDLDGNLLYVNDTLVKMLGYNAPMELLKDNVLQRYKTSGDRKLLLDALKTKGKVVDFEVDLVCKSGSILTAILYAVLKKSQIFGVLVDITQRKQIENDLVESEAYNKLLFLESRTPIVILDPETGKFIDCNPAATKIYDYKNYEEVIGKTPLDVSAPFQYDGTDSASAAKKHIEKALNWGSHRFEWYHQRPDSTTWDAEVFLMTFQYKKKYLLQFTLQDITERKQMTKKLKDSQEKYQTILDTMKDAVYICSSEFILEYMNPAMIERIGKNATGEYCYKAIYNNERSCPWCELKKIHTSDIVEYDLNNPLDQKDYFITNIPIFNSNGGFSKLTIARDITKRKQYEKRLTAEKEKLQKAIDEIKTLKGMVPICSNCKKIRDDKGYWNLLESYIEKNSEASFSHGMCPDCSDKFYGKENWYIKMKKRQSDT